MMPDTSLQRETRLTAAQNISKRLDKNTEKGSKTPKKDMSDGKFILNWFVS